MRLLQLEVHDDRLEPILDVLQDGQFGYTVTEGGGKQDRYSVVTAVVPADAVEDLLDDLGEAGYERKGLTVSLKTEFADYEHVDEVQNEWAKTPNRLAPTTLRSKAKDLRLNTRSYLWMMVLSAVVATAGLLQASPAVVVGSMVIAPIVSPALTAGVGAVRDDRGMFLDSIHMQLLGLAVAIGAATATSLLVKELGVIPVTRSIEQLELVSLRLSPSMLSLAVGVAAGAAGAYGLATKGRTTILGVMIAAALIPTAAAVGIGLAWTRFIVAIGALLLLMLSIIAINVGVTTMLFYLNYRPDNVDEGILHWDNLGRAVMVLGTLGLVAVIIVLVASGFFAQSSFERTVNGVATDVLNEDRYSDLEVRALNLEYVTPIFVDETTVTLTVTRTTDQSYPDLPSVLAEKISARTDRDVRVRVRYVDFQESASTSPSGSVGRLPPASYGRGTPRVTSR